MRMRPIYETACFWPKGGTVTIHPAARRGRYRDADALVEAFRPLPS